MNVANSVPARQHQFVTADGTQLCVRESGPSAAAVTVVLVHGWTQDSRTWDPVLAQLRRWGQHCRVLRYDHRGHGGSARASAGSATIEQLADDLAELLTRRVPSGPVVLAGHSMGGMAIMALAARHSALVTERVAGVAFVATSCDRMDRITLGLPGAAGNAAVRLERRLATGLAGMRRDRLPLRPALARQGARLLVFGRGAHKSALASVADQLLRADPANVGQFEQAISGHDQRAALATFGDTPAAVLAGERDRLCPLPHAYAIARQLPDAEFVRFPGAGHMLAHERAPEVAARIAALVSAGTHNT